MSARRRSVLKRRASSLPRDLAVVDPKRARLGAVSDDTPIQPGFPSLPPEIHWQIIEHLSDDMGFEVVMANPQPSMITHERIARADTLRALSQVCASLRQEFLPVAWRHVYACTSAGGGAWYLQVARMLDGMCHGLMRHAYLAVHVQVMTIALTRTEQNKILPALASCLSALPNLHTLEFVHVHSEMTTALGKAFEGKSYPQIRRIVMPSCAHNILRACPEVREVICNEDNGSKLVSAIAKTCKKVEVFKGLRGDANFIKRLIRAAPGLRELALGPEGVTPDVMSLLSGFKHLERLELYEFPPIRPNGWNTFPQTVTNTHIYASKGVIEGAKAAMKNSTATRKTIVWIEVSRRLVPRSCKTIETHQF